MVVTLKAGADGSIPAQDVAISATAPAGYEAIQSVKVHVNALNAGGVATYNATLVAVKTTPEEQIVIEGVREVGAPRVSELLNPTHNHAGKSWWENANDYILITKVSYKLYNQQKAAGEVKDVDVTEFIKSLNYNDTKDSVLEMKISAWSIYRAWFEVYPVTTTYKIKKGGDLLGTITADALNGTAAQYEEMAHPSHAHAYQHGHGHGASENAGGGIVLPD